MALTRHEIYIARMFLIIGAILGAGLTATLIWSWILLT